MSSRLGGLRGAFAHLSSTQDTPQRYIIVVSPSPPSGLARRAFIRRFPCSALARTELRDELLRCSAWARSTACPKGGRGLLYNISTNMILFLPKCYITSAPILYNIPRDIILLFSLPPSCQLRLTRVAPPSRIAGLRWRRVAKGCSLSFGRPVHRSLGLQPRMSLGRRLFCVVQKFDTRKMLLVKNIYRNFAP